jgi:septum formation protein
MSSSVWLASASPRRRELLTQIGIPFTVIPAPVDESRLPGETAEAYVMRLAVAKACAGDAAVLATGGHPAPVIGADTSVVLGDTILGKPAHEADAVDMLQSLSGREHRVLTAVAVTKDGHHQARLSETRVRFREISVAEARAYWNSGEPRDKAGAYGIQGLGAVFVESISGSYSGVVGLPIFETTELLKLYKVACWQ